MQYTTGTVTVDNGSAIVIGAGTAWLANATAGQSFKVAALSPVYTIASVDSDTQLHLTVNYAGADGAGLGYQICRDFTPNRSYPELNVGDADWPNHVTESLRKIDADVAGDKTDITALQTTKAPLADPELTGTPTAPTAAVGTNTTQIATTAYAKASAPNATYRTRLRAGGSHTAGQVAGTYEMMASGAIQVTGVGSGSPPATIYLAAADYPTINGLAPKLRIRAQLYTNDVAPTGNFTISLHPITRPGTSGGAGVCIFTVGAAVAGSSVAFNTPAADGFLQGDSGDFALPADGHYIIAVVTTATVAANSHVQITAEVQMHNA